MPDPFLEVVTQDLASSPGLTGHCAGFENGKWRSDQLASHLMEWLPDFALNHEEREGLASGNAVALIQKAASLVYDTDKFKKRGEFGELLLHVMLRETFGTIPAISKIYYKDSKNNTVKGFDAVHVVPAGEGLELWLGEVKFYANIKLAIAHVVKEIEAHTQDFYLRSEFTLIANKVEASWPHADKLKKLLHKNTSLDNVFSAACVPVLLTYDSDVVAAATKADAAYRSAIDKELRSNHQLFAKAGLPKNIRVHLFLLPMNSKAILIDALHERLKAWQKIL